MDKKKSILSSSLSVYLIYLFLFVRLCSRADLLSQRNRIHDQSTSVEGLTLSWKVLCNGMPTCEIIAVAFDVYNDTCMGRVVSFYRPKLRRNSEWSTSEYRLTTFGDFFRPSTQLKTTSSWFFLIQRYLDVCLTMGISDYSFLVWKAYTAGSGISLGILTIVLVR